jgi:hypothetical protein
MRIFKFLSHKLTFVLIFLISIGLFISSCKKEGKHYYISEEFKSWCLFQRGSYWIYSNDSTMLLDSVFLTSDPLLIDVQSNQDKGSPTHQVIEMNLSSLLFKYCRIDATTNGDEIFWMSISNNNPTALWAHYPQYFIPTSNYTTIEQYKTLAYDSTFIIGSNNFSNVVQTQYSLGTSDKFVFYFAKHIGLIKVIFETPDSTVSWSLLRYHAIQ